MCFFWPLNQLCGTMPWRNSNPFHWMISDDRLYVICGSRVFLPSFACTYKLVWKQSCCRPWHKQGESESWRICCWSRRGPWSLLADRYTTWLEVLSRVEEALILCADSNLLSWWAVSKCMRILERRVGRSSKLWACCCWWWSWYVWTHVCVRACSYNIHCQGIVQENCCILCFLDEWMLACWFGLLWARECSATMLWVALLVGLACFRHKSALLPSFGWLSFSESALAQCSNWCLTPVAFAAHQRAVSTRSTCSLWCGEVCCPPWLLASRCTYVQQADQNRNAMDMVVRSLLPAPDDSGTEAEVWGFGCGCLVMANGFGAHLVLNNKFVDIMQSDCKIIGLYQP